MKVWVRVIDLVVSLALIPLAIGVLPVILPATALPAVLIGVVVLIGAYLIWRLLAFFPEIRFGRLHGVVGVASDRGPRPGDFSEPWMTAKKTLVTWGVGMTNLARDESIITKGLERNLSVKIEIVDPDWLRKHPDRAAQVDAMYGRPRFVEQIEDSTVQLVAIARKLNQKFGEGRIQVWAIQEFYPQSGTVADPGTNHAWGWVEWHNYGFPHGQARFKLRSYRHRSLLDPPLLQHVLDARKNLPQRRVDNLPRRREDKGKRKSPRIENQKDTSAES